MFNGGFSLCLGGRECVRGSESVSVVGTVVVGGGDDICRSDEDVVVVVVVSLFASVSSSFFTSRDRNRPRLPPTSPS